MSKKKIKWTDTEDIAFLLIDRYPSQDASKLSLSDISKRASAIPGLAGTTKPSHEILESIKQCWFEERADMEDELGPISTSHEQDDLDEDGFRDDRMIDDEHSVPAFDGDDDDDEDEDDLAEGFHEEEISDDH